MASSAKSGLTDSIFLAKQAGLEAVVFSGTGRRLARVANGLGIRVLKASSHFRRTPGPATTARVDPANSVPWQFGVWIFFHLLVGIKYYD